MNEVERVELAPGYSIARVINGCWQLTPDHGGGPGSEAETLRFFAELVEHGFTTFDCADIYTGVEQLLGKFRLGLADPDRIQIHTKFAPDRNTLHALNNKDIDASIDRSLRRLGVEQLDLLQFHWWDYDTPGLHNLVDRLVRAQRAGKIRLLGTTNFDTAHMREIIAGGADIVSLQSQYSLLDRRPEKQMANLAAQTGIVLLPYGVLAGGFLTGKYLHAPSPASMNRSLQKYRLIIDETGGWSALQELLELLDEIARRHGTSIGAIATRWVLDRPHVAAVILGIGSQSRARDNLALANLQLDERDRQAIACLLQKQTIPAGDMYELERDPGGPHTKIIKMNLHDGEDRQ
ncbi:MAG: aldo/keto reductase [Xanthomonadales bacterium]|nr:aldo/keto reductase [Xanthomonadales bacterium]